MRQSKSFSASSPVTRYWLANCVGFAVKGGVRGTVEGALSEDDPHVPATLLVRTTRHRVRQVPTASVVSVVPSQRLLVVRSSPRATVVYGRAAARHARLAARVGGQIAVRLCVAGWRGGRRAWAAGSPVVVEWSQRAASESWRLLRSVPWRRYGRFARSATTRLSQDLSRLWSRLRTTLSRPSNANDSSGEASTTSST